MDRLETLKQLVKRFDDNYREYKGDTYNEHSCRDEFINPFLEILGWDVTNSKGLAPQYREVIAEYHASSSDRPEYSLTLRGVSKFFVEAKKPHVDISKDPSPAVQARKYGWNAKHKIAVLTNFEYFIIYDTTTVPHDNDKCSVSRYRIYKYTEYVEKLDEITKLVSRDSVYSGDFDNSNGFQKLKHVKEKWTKYFVSAEEIKVIQSIRDDKRFTKFADLALINVGITTGNNTYFSVDKTTNERYDLSSVTLPLIGRSSHAHGINFTDSDWQENIQANKRALLISFPDTPYEEYPAKHKEYIELGERNEENKGYKCSIRDRWYIVPSVWIPDAFFLRRNNLYPKFVLNRCNAVSTDTMHRIKFNEGVNAENVLLSYYNSISFAFTEICGRSYGGGVLEILPGEVGNIMLPVVNNIDEALKNELLKQIDTIVRNDEDIESALDLVDQRLLVEVLGIDKNICVSCRQIWKKMQKRRLGRG